MTNPPSPPDIFEAALIRRRLRRARQSGDESFLIPTVIDEFAERLAAVTRNFTRIADIGTPSDTLGHLLAKTFPAADVLRLAPIEDDRTTLPVRALPLNEDLGLEPQTLDLAVSALALQAANDLPGVFIQIRKALKPDGLFLACLLGGQTLKELRIAFATAESELSGGASPRVAPFADVRDIGRLLQRAGFALPVVDVEPLTVRYGDPTGLLRDLRAMGATNALSNRDRRPLRRAILLRALEIYRLQNADSDGRVRATFEIIWLSGWAPDPSQQKPSKPGSAQIRLSDVLPTRDYGDQTR